MKSMKTKVQDVDVEIIKFNPFKGGVLLGQTTKMFAPAIKDLVVATQNDLDEAQQLDILLGAVQGLFESNSPEEVMAYVKELLATGYVIVGKNKIHDLDDLESLSGENGDGLLFMMMLVVESIKYNFAGLLKKLIPQNG